MLSESPAAPGADPESRRATPGILSIRLLLLCIAVAFAVAGCGKPESTRDEKKKSASSLKLKDGKADTRVGVKMLNPTETEVESIRLELDRIYGEITRLKGDLANSKSAANAPDRRRMLTEINRLETEKVRYELALDVGSPGSLKLDSDPKNMPVEMVKLPVDRVLRNNEGRDLDVSIIGRSTTHLTILRRSDSTRFDIPINSLSVADQAFARTLAVQAPPVFREEPKIPPYIASRMDQIERLKQKTARLEIDLDSSSNSILIRNYKDQMKKNKAEIAKLEADIKRYGLNNED